jgi:hypothetical protein
MYLGVSVSDNDYIMQTHACHMENTTVVEMLNGLLPRRYLPKSRNMPRVLSLHPC